jgi:hypothetical protein
MDNSKEDEGLIQVLLEKLEKQRLPRLFALKEKVDGGSSLDDSDIDYLETAIKDARKVIPLIDKHTEYQALAAQVLKLYKDITEKALQIEKS